MRTISVSEAKATLSEQLRHVQEGEEVVITDRGRPIARMVPASATAEDPRVQRLVDKGLARAGSGVFPEQFWTTPRPSDPKGLTLDALLAEREESR